MHTGDFRSYFEGKLDVAGMKLLHFGVNTDENPGSNPSVTVYAQGRMKSWNGGDDAYQTTAVYKKDYVERIKVFCAENGELFLAVPKRVQNNPQDYLKDITYEVVDSQIERGRLVGDEGLPTTPAFVYNQDEIDSIICYSESEAKLLKVLFESRQDLNRINIYVMKRIPNIEDTTRDSFLFEKFK